MSPQANDSCPSCGAGKVAVRAAKSTGAKFLGCSRFPECRWTGRHDPAVETVLPPEAATPPTPPMLPARPIDCPNPCAAWTEPEPGVTIDKVAACFRTLLQLLFAEGCQDRKVREVMDRLRNQYGGATIMSLRAASKKKPEVAK